MKWYESLLKLGCFSFEELAALVGFEATPISILRSYLKHGYVVTVKRGLYAAVNLLDHEPAVSRFVIASKISDTAVVSHHSAFEYYGYAEQVYFDMTVTSKSKFNAFTFNEYRYSRVQPTISKGVSVHPDGERVTDIERTVLDSINDFEKNMGFEELIKCISAIPLLNENKLQEYLAEYDKAFLYQKTGYILEQFQADFGISDVFLDHCKNRMGSSSRYLVKDIPKESMDFSSRWHLTVPRDLWRRTLGGDENAEI